MQQWLLVLMVLLHNTLAFELYENINDYHLWRRGIPSTVTESRADCKKDILVLWDNSRSVGKTSFKQYVRPFLKNFIRNENLNVGKEGTQIGFITFATEKKTRKLLKIGEITDAAKLINWLDELDYDKDLIGDGTRTGLALKMADNVFSLESPQNHRANVEDVVLLFTDGEPIRRRWEKNQEYRNENEMADHYSKQLKAKNITIIGMAVGTKNQLDKFYGDIVKWSSSRNHVFSAKKNELNSVLNRLITTTKKCERPAPCKCDGIFKTTNLYIKPDEETAEVNLPEPTLNCNAVGVTKTVNPAVKSRYHRGKHSIIYTFSYNDRDQQFNLKCFINFTVVACECSSTPQTVNEKIKPGDKEALVNWSLPTVSCPATLKNQKTSGFFSVGKHTITHEFIHSNAFQTFRIECPVNIVVTGEFCGGKSYDTANQVCCCGQIYKKKSGSECCGMKYYNPSKKICCDNQKANLVPRGSNCP